MTTQTDQTEYEITVDTLNFDNPPGWNRFTVNVKSKSNPANSITLYIEIKKTHSCEDDKQKALEKAKSIINFDKLKPEGAM